MKKTIYILFILSIFSCDRMDYGLHIINNTNDTIVLNYFEKDVISQVVQFYYPQNNKWQYLLPPDDTLTLANPVSWKEYINYCEDSSLIIYVFNKNILDKFPWDTVKKNSSLYIKYKFNNRNLDSVNWTIRIPPSLGGK